MPLFRNPHPEFKSAYHQTVAWASEIEGLPKYMVAARDLGDTDLEMRWLFALVARLLPRRERWHLYALLRYAHIRGMAEQRDQDDKIASGKMIWSDEWNTWIDKPEEP